MDFQIRSATDADTPAISRVIIGTLRESNAQDYSSEIIDHVEHSFSPPAILNFLTLRQVLVATVDNHVVATASLDLDTVRSVFVAPPYQGAGIGRRLMTSIESLAIESSINLLRVPSSITAEGFYLSIGFTKTRDEYHGAERTIVMEKRLDR
jgi:N-acetylglutamate synthase-like GNAT family acetyltransferase